MEFLTVDEVIKVDTALLSSQDKFLARVALYSLRSLSQIAQDTHQSLDEISAAQVMAWIEQDETVRQQIEADEGFKTFFTQLVLSSLQPLQQAAAAHHKAIATLTVADVVGWFEQAAKAKLNIQ